MKRLTLALFVVLCLVSALFLNNHRVSAGESPRTWTVRPPGQGGDFNKIQDAINNANLGDTIFVYRGTYNESVVVNTTVSLIGEDMGQTIIVGNEAECVVYINASNVVFKNFTITKSNSGIRIERSSGNSISQNNITGNDEGIRLYTSKNNTISNNIITNNDAGISLYMSNNNMISNNDISSNNYGIVLYFSYNNMILANTISSNNYEGVSLHLSKNNLIWGNTISFNKNHGINIDSSYNTTIFCNNFNNLHQVSLTDSISVWNYGYEGNYWSDYNGTDYNHGPYQNETGADGIGDTIHDIDAYNRDYRPLMGTFSVFNIPLKRETYHIIAISNSTIPELTFEIRPETGAKILRFKAKGEDNTFGFCRIMIPIQLTNYSFDLYAGEEEINSTFLNVPIFLNVPTFLNVSSEAYVYLYFTYLHGSGDIAIVSSETLYLLNKLLDQHTELQEDFDNLSAEYNDLVENYTTLLSNYTLLQESYQKHLSDYFRNVDNIQSLMYIFAATTAIFMITTIYLSKVAHVGILTKKKETQTT